MPVVNYDWDELEDNIVEEYDDAGATIADYTTESDHFGNVISQHRGGQSSFFHYDGQGSTLAVTDEGQDITDSRAYTAFGETTESSGSTVFAIQYIGEQGYYHDGVTHQYIAKRRVYEPVVARWLAVDRQDTGRGRTNPYMYSENAPIALADPSGLAPAGTAAFCKVELVCLSLTPGVLIIPSVKHCGLRVSDGARTFDYNVLSPTAGLAGDKCRITSSLVFPLGLELARYYVYSSWSDPTGALCACIHKKVVALNAANLPYDPIPDNSVTISYVKGECVDGPPKCNSNYATHCLMKSCNIDYTGGYFVAPGWDHRIKKCSSISKDSFDGCTVCGCRKWGPPVDGAWCDDPPFLPIRPHHQDGPHRL